MKKKTLKDILFSDPGADEGSSSLTRESVADGVGLMDADALREVIMELYDFDEGWRAKSEISSARVARAMADQYKYFHIGMDDDPLALYDPIFGEGTDFILGAHRLQMEYAISVKRKGREELIESIIGGKK